MLVAITASCHVANALAKVANTSLKISKMSKKCLFGKKLQELMGFSNFKFQREKGNLTSPKLSEVHKKLENLPQRHFGARKKTAILFSEDSIT